MDINSNFPNVVGVAPPGRTVWQGLGTEPRFVHKPGIDNSKPGYTNEVERIAFWTDRVQHAIDVVNGDVVEDIPEPRQLDLSPEGIIKSVLGMSSEDHLEMVATGKRAREIYKED